MRSSIQRFRTIKVALILLAQVATLAVAAGVSGLAAPSAPTGITWTVGAAPPPRYWAAATFAPCQLIAYGGALPTNKASRDTLLYDPVADGWATVGPPKKGGPPGLVHAGLTWDASRGLAIMFGGTTGISRQEIAWGFDPGREEWTQLVGACRTCPPARTLHGQAWSSVLGATLMFGGEGSGRVVFDDLWKLQASAGRRGGLSWGWTRLQPAPDIGGGFPEARFAHGMIEIVAGPHAGKILIYGGWNDKGDALSDTWFYDPVADAFDEIATNAPTPRVAFGIGHLANRIVIQGGQTNSQRFGEVHTDETWTFNQVTLAWEQVDTPARPDLGRSFHDLASNTCDGTAILFDQPFAADPPTPTWILR